MGSPPQAATADSHHINNMDYLSDTENFYNYDYNDIMAPRAAGTTNTLFLGVFITIIPKLLPRIMPAVMTSAAPEIKAKFDAPDFIETNEEMLKEEFTKYFQIIEDIVATFNGESMKKSSEYTGFQRFLLGCLESLDIDVTKFIGQLELRRVQQLGEIARGTDPNSGMYNAIADAIIAMGTFLYESLF